MVADKKGNKIKDISKFLDIKEIYIKDGIIKIVIHENGNEESFYNLQEKINIIMKDESGKTHCADCIKMTLDNGEVHMMINIEDWALKMDMESGVYDVYVKSGDKMIALKSTECEVLSEKERIRFPRIVVIDKIGMKYSVKTHYTKNNSLAIKISKLIEIKYVSSVEVKNSGIRMKGVMYIRRAYSVQEDKMYGRIKIPLKNGENIEFNYMADVVLRENANVQYDYIMSINKDDIKSQGYSAKEVISMLSGNTVQCSIDGVDGKVEYIMNIDPGVLIMTFKDKLRKCKIVKSFFKK